MSESARRRACVLVIGLAVFSQVGCSTPAPTDDPERANVVLAAGEGVARRRALVESNGAQATPAEGELHSGVRLESLTDADERFPNEPLPAPRVAALPGDAIERPAGLPGFCMDMNPDVVRFARVPINGPACAHHTSEWTAPPPRPSVPFPRTRLCHRLRQLSSLDNDGGQPAPCALEQALPRGYAIYVVGTPSFETYFLVHRSSDTADVVAPLGTYSSGDGSRHEAMRGHDFRQEAGALVLTWRDATTDWDLGVEEFHASEECRAIRCQRDGRGHRCSPPTTLRSYGGLYSAGWGDADRPEVREPKEQWDCRPR